MGSIGETPTSFEPRRAEPRKPRASQPPRRVGADPAAISRASALKIATSILEKKGIDVQIIDVVGRVDYADFVVVASGRSDRHVAAIVQGIEEDLKRARMPLIAVEGLSQSVWVLVDVGDVIAHIFQESVRAQYDIEGLWMDAPRVRPPADAGP